MQNHQKTAMTTQSNKPDSQTVIQMETIFLQRNPEELLPAYLRRAFAIALKLQKLARNLDYETCPSVAVNKGDIGELVLKPEPNRTIDEMVQDARDKMHNLGTRIRTFKTVKYTPNDSTPCWCWDEVHAAREIAIRDQCTVMFQAGPTFCYIFPWTHVPSACSDLMRQAFRNNRVLLMQQKPASEITPGLVPSAKELGCRLRSLSRDNKPNIIVRKEKCELISDFLERAFGMAMAPETGDSQSVTAVVETAEMVLKLPRNQDITPAVLIERAGNRLRNMLYDARRLQQIDFAPDNSATNWNSVDEAVILAKLLNCNVRLLIGSAEVFIYPWNSYQTVRSQVESLAQKHGLVLT
jgi:hypothetical protein